MDLAPLLYKQRQKISFISWNIFKRSYVLIFRLIKMKALFCAWWWEISIIIFTLMSMLIFTIFFTKIDWILIFDFTKRQCNKFECHDKLMAMMHLGVTHNRLIELVGTHLRKNISTKNIGLKIDLESRWVFSKHTFIDTTSLILLFNYNASYANYP